MLMPDSRLLTKTIDTLKYQADEGRVERIFKPFWLDHAKLLFLWKVAVDKCVRDVHVMHMLLEKHSARNFCSDRCEIHNWREFFLHVFKWLHVSKSDEACRVSGYRPIVVSLDLQKTFVWKNTANLRTRHEFLCFTFNQSQSINFFLHCRVEFLSVLRADCLN